jgi:transcriptional regulator with XRE-family HTH domain
MTNTFALWLEYSGLSINEAAEKLDLGRNRVAAYKRGRTTKPVMPAIPDKRTRLAMAAIAFGIDPWPLEVSDVESYTQISEDNTEEVIQNSEK